MSSLVGCRHWTPPLPAFRTPDRDGLPLTPAQRTARHRARQKQLAAGEMVEPVRRGPPPLTAAEKQRRAAATAQRKQERSAAYNARRAAGRRAARQERENPARDERERLERFEAHLLTYLREQALLAELRRQLLIREVG